MDEELKKTLSKAADTVRALSFEAVQKANSGHPGLPMGCAELGVYLYGEYLRHNPKDPHWVNRDRVILSAGHGSMWLYSLLHLSGFDLSMDELKRFRQLHSETPGHPEYGDTAGVEATTGPLGQGIGNAVGHSLGLRLLAEKFNKSGQEIITAKVICLAGDGCLMEGVSHEACSLAGHLQLNNLILIHDDNKITLDGPLEQSNSENTPERFRAYGWDVYEMDGNNLEELDEVLSKLKSMKQERPIFISMKTIIGKGSPHKQGTHKAHGSPLGPDEVEATKKNLGIPEEDFFVPQPVQDYFEKKLKARLKEYEEWKKDFESWRTNNPDLAKEFDAMKHREIPKNIEEMLHSVEIEEPIAGRAASQAVIQKLGDMFPFLYGGSADLSGSDCTMMKQYPLVSPSDFSGRNIKFGVREFGMATIASGMWQTGLILPFVGTFLTFSDYMRNAIRLAALSKYHVIYQFTHDSIFLGEDGPTHQSIEHYMALRAMPNLHVLRPADANEVRMAWVAALKYEGPSAIILTRQKLPRLEGTKVPYKEGVGKGAYIARKEKASKVDFTLMATGSEVSLAYEVADALEKMDKSVRVISMPCWELFEKQGDAYHKEILGGDLGMRVSIESGVSLGWEKWTGPEGVHISIDTFGASAPINDLKQEYGFTVEAILDRILK